MYISVRGNVGIGILNGYKSKLYKKTFLKNQTELPEQEAALYYS